MTYTATARLVEMDAAAGMLLLEASGMKTRGAGTASATIRFVLEDRGDATLVVVRTTLDVTGRPAQFGRGVVSEVTRKMVEQFAANLAEMVAAGRVRPRGGVRRRLPDRPACHAGTSRARPDHHPPGPRNVCRPCRPPLTDRGIHRWLR